MDHSVNGPFDDQTTYEHLNTGQVWYSDSHCTFLSLFFYLHLTVANLISPRTLYFNLGNILTREKVGLCQIFYCKGHAVFETSYPIFFFF